MTLDINQPASGIPEVLFIAEQPDRDTIQMPTSSDTVFLAGDASFDQEPIIAENNEKRDTYADQEGKLAAFKMGAWSFSTNLRVPGSLGVAPPGAPLYKSLYGRETIDAGVDVTYEHYRKTDPLVYMTILFAGDIETYLITGAQVMKGSVKINDKILSVDWSGSFSRKYRAGTDETSSEIDGTSTPVTVIPITHSAKNFDIGAYIVVGSDDNSGSGFKITAKNETSKELTIEGGVSTLQPAGSIVKGWAPVVQEAGYNVIGIIGDFKIDRGSLETFDVISATLDIDGGIKDLGNEKSGSLYPTKTGRGKRKISLNWDGFESVGNLDVKAYVERYEAIPCVIDVGDEAGKIVTFSIPNFKPTKAGSSGSEEKKQAISGQCFPDSGDDETTLVFK